MDSPGQTEGNDTEENEETGITKVDKEIQVTELEKGQKDREDFQKIQEIHKNWKRKIHRFESIASQRELSELRYKEKLAKDAETARALSLQERKKALISRHFQSLESKRKRAEQIRLSNDNYRKIKATVPLHTKLSLAFHSLQTHEIELQQRELQSRKLRMRSLDQSEFTQHEEIYEQRKNELLTRKKSEREDKMKQIREENKSMRYYQSPLYELEEEEKRGEKEKEEEKARLEREVWRRGKVYGELAMEIYRPKLRKLEGKRRETEEVRNVQTPIISPNLFKRRRYKVRKEAEIATPSPPPPKDYNTERRHILVKSLLSDRSSPIFHYQSHDFDASTPPSVLLTEANRLSSAAHLGDIQLHRLDDQPELQSLVCERVSAMHIDSIKARLELLKRSGVLNTYEAIQSGGVHAV